MNNAEMSQLMNQLESMPSTAHAQSGKSIEHLNPNINPNLNQNSIAHKINNELEQNHDIFDEDSINTETDQSLEILKSISENDELIEEKENYNIVKEFCLLIAVYYFLSMGFVKNIIGNVAPIINPFDDGSVSPIGIIFYGLILCSLFFGLRNLII